MNAKGPDCLSAVRPLGVQLAALEVELDAQLDYAGGDALHTGSHRSESLGPDVAVQSLGIGIEVVEQVEEFRAEFECAVFHEADVLGCREIDILGTRKADRVGAGSRTEAPVRCQ